MNAATPTRPDRTGAPALHRLWAWLFTGLFACLGGVASAADLPYDERADGAALVQHALEQARAEHKELLVVFGANWCPDCRVLDSVLHSPGALDLAQRFVLVKLDVGSFDRNIDLARRFGVPLGKGIPAVALVDSDEKPRYVTRGGELADAQKMGGTAIVEFFNRVLADAAVASAPPIAR